MREDSYKTQGMRKQLVRKLREKGITDDAVLAAIEKVPRHFFFDPDFIDHSYQDKAFPIGEGQTISQPYTVAVQTSLLNIKKGDKVLEIGTGSGYQCCILLELGAKVYTIENKRVLHQKSSTFLRSLNYQAEFLLGDGTLGWEKNAPYDKIIVTAGAPHVPEKLIDQLKPNGILVIPVGDESSQDMIRIQKLPDGRIKKDNFGAFRFVPLKGKDGW